MKRIEQVSLGAILVSVASPAFAGAAVPTPAPVIGVGLGAIVLVGIGYRALKSRIDR